MDEQFDFYETYDADRYVHYRSVPTGEFDIIQEKRNGNIVSKRTPILEKQKISFDEVKKINLDNYGQDARTATEDFTLVHNYLLDFWSAIMGDRAVMMYIHLKRYCFGNKDFCYPSLSTIRSKMKISSNTTSDKLIDILEHYGFIIKINRFDKKNNNMSVSPFFKVRRYIPLLTNELIKLLPKNLQKEHDKFLARANGIELDNTFEPEHYINELMQSTNVMKSKNQKNKELELIRQGKLKKYILSQITKEEKEVWCMFLKEFSNRVSKPSFDVWLKDTIILLNKEQKSLHLYCPNTFTVGWLQREYKHIIINAALDLFDIQIQNYDCNLYDDYITG